MYQLRIFTESFLSLFAIMRLSGITTKNPLSLILFLVIIHVFTKLHSDKTESRIETKDPLIAAILSVLFTLFTLSANYNTILGSMTSMLFCTIILFLSGLGVLLIYYYLSLWLLQSAGALKLIHKGYSYAWLPFAAFVICLICWLPYFLYEYPAIMTPDSINQYAQVIGAYELSNHHSIIHTAIIGFCCNVGLSITGNIYFGLALYTILQMLFMAFVASYVVKTLQLADAAIPVLIITICFYALIPYNGIYAVTMWKDIPFAGFMTVFAAALMRFLLRGNSSSAVCDIPKLSVSEYFTLVIPYVISCIMMCLLRTNGWYAFVILVPFILIIYRKCLKTMIPVHLIIIALVLFIKYPVMDIYDIKQADFVESLSIPVQQIACVVANNEPLSSEQIEFLGNIMDLSQVSSLYRPDVSDNIKNLIRQSGNNYLETHKIDFIKIWFSIGLRHPKSYFDAYVAQTNGYWYPDVSYEVGLADGIYQNEFGLNWHPVIRGNVIIKIKEILFKLPELIPIYAILWSMGFILWLALFAAALCLRLGKSENILICMPFILLIITLCIAAPVATEFRYAYPAFYALPLLLMSPFVNKR